MRQNWLHSEVDNHSFVSGNETFNFQGDWIKLARSESSAAKLHKENAWFQYFKSLESMPLILPRQVSFFNNRVLMTSSIYGESASERFLNDNLSEREFGIICKALLEFQKLPVEEDAVKPSGSLYAGRVERLGAAQDIKEWFKPLLENIPELTYSHGDYHLGNILLTERGVGVVDPGEYPVFDPRYDWAKLYHSLRGYNHLIEDVNFIIDSNIEAKFFEHCPYPREEIEKLTGFLFLTMLPLHQRGNQLKILNKANEILEPLGLRKVYLSDYSAKSELYVDFDGTIVSLEKDFMEGEPNEELITVLRDYYENNKRIVIYTARGMKSNNGDLAIIEKNVKPRIAEWLRLHNVPYHELIVGKPFWEILIDDRVKNIEDVNSWIF